MKVSEAREHLPREEQEKLIDQDAIAKEALARVQDSGIVLLDELRKVAGRQRAAGPEASREGG